MATKGKRPMRALTASDKIEAIQRVNDGESKASVARDIGVPESTLRGWCKNEDKLRYMSSRRSSPDTDKSCDGDLPEKRARTESPPAASPSPPVETVPTPVPPTPTHPAPHGLDLSAPPAADTPVELTTRRTEPPHARDRRPEPGASVSMSAISPLSGLTHMPGLGHSHLGLSFNEIATNLSLLAQLNPGLGALAAAPPQPTQPPRALRSVRSPKPAHNGALNLTDKHRTKTHHNDHYDITRSSRSKSSHHTKDAVDDALWYWLKTQQAMLDLTAQAAPAHTLHLKAADLSAPKPSPTATPVPPAAPSTPLSAHFDYNRNTWFWQYYKQFGGAIPPPDDKLKSAAQVPKEKNENILYSHLIKGKTHEEDTPTVASELAPAPAHTTPHMTGHTTAHTTAHATAHMTAHTTVHTAARTPSIEEAPRVEEYGDAERSSAPAVSPDRGNENKELTGERHEPPRSQAKARNVLDNLLFNNNGGRSSDAAAEGAGVGTSSDSEWEAGASEALEHGDKFLAWLEASGDPAVTRVHVHQLRALLQNLRARRALVPTK